MLKKDILSIIESLALKAAMMDIADIPLLGEVLRIIEAIEKGLPQDNELIPLVTCMKEWVEEAIMGEEKDPADFGDAATSLREAAALLGSGMDASMHIEEGLAKVCPGMAGEAGIQGKEDRAGEESRKKKAVISREDRETILDFVSEAMEDLNEIEANLVLLEEDPTDLEVMNAVFRPFHTIKGVSGFLNFENVKRLAHSLESLLDRARNREMVINREFIDIVLDGVDLIKRMLCSIDESTKKGYPDEGVTGIMSFLERVDGFVQKVEEKKATPLGSLLVDRGLVDEKDIAEALEEQKKGKDARLGEILVAKKKIDSKKLVSVIREQKRYRPPESLSVKVDTSKLDSLVDMVGELAIAQSMLRQHPFVKESRDRRLINIVNHLCLVGSGIQKVSMSLRMVPIRRTFQKMVRLVRDLSKKSGKDVRLVMNGEETEIDRNMVDEIYEPLVHMVRNAVDHGIEPAEERARKNKPKQGTLFLRAYHKGGEIVIEIEDDGRGLDHEKIFEKAVSLGLVEAGSRLSKSEIEGLIFHPGFSTAAVVTDISGRGVGTDVVIEMIKRFHGRIEVISRKGIGTRFVMSLPLTLAILDGMIVSVAKERFILPVSQIKGFIKPADSDVFTASKKTRLLRMRDEHVPVLHLDRLLGLKTPGVAGDDDVEKKMMVIVEHRGGKKALAVDELIGREEVVIKSLGRYLKKVRGMAGGSILGDGRVGLVIDIAGLFDTAGEG